MAFATYACLRPTNFPLSTADSPHTVPRYSRNSLAFRLSSHFLGTELSFRTRTLPVTNERRVFSCVNSGNVAGEDIDVLSTPKAREDKLWSRLLKRGSEIVSENVNRFSKPAMAIVLSLLLLQSNPELALAAGGGRVGGRVGGGSSFSSKSFSAPSRSYSAPSGGYSRPERSYVAPSPGFSYAVPYAAPSPFFGRSYYSAPTYGIGFGGGGLFFFVLLGFIVLQSIYGFVSEGSKSGGSTLFTGSQKTSVVKLQVGLLGMARTLQKDLDRIANQADTTTAEGLHSVLTETCLALMRHPEYCTSAFASTDVNRSAAGAEERFNNLSLEERAKFDAETLINVNNLRKKIMAAPKSERLNNEYIVVTILVAADGEFKLPAINSNADLKAALRKLGSIPTDAIQSVEVLWTPQDEDDTLNERELLRDYPLLLSL
ncbi:FLUCTUATING-LIGHT-ACCLIMATION protein 1, chloroplastic [Physcomitrium patens]|uniref:Uncharacterized protein n=1 Tax=Physcomitrium patens TaxID=3218 RepID=A0A2K1K3R4_PHYPA|nr:uncharacterized protein LOC112286674 [Physcomitrium patens]PNR48422.1 hypothetical protein PHYPA_012898 [Physcomitrium patens]|eukprot:XP_024384563.1 uncharacterized protein LOC112286674 [Physcomitrella patens]